MGKQWAQRVLVTEAQGIFRGALELIFGPPWHHIEPQPMPRQLARIMTTGGNIVWMLLSLALLGVAVFISLAALDLLQVLERARADGDDLFFIEEEQFHARVGGLLSLPFWIGGILAGLKPLNAWRSRKR
jgi:hypothetical protein